LVTRLAECEGLNHKKERKTFYLLKSFKSKTFYFWEIHDNANEIIVNKNANWYYLPDRNG
jgi:hypothetical protein